MGRLLEGGVTEELWDRPTVSVLVLAKDEAASIAEVLRGAAHSLSSLDLSFELVVVDGGSFDGTADLAAKAGARVLIQSAAGYACALQEGFAACRGEWVLTLDADGSHDPALIRALLAARHDHEIVVGSRWISGGSHEGSRLRAVSSRVLNRVFQLTLALPVRDVSSGFRLYQRKLLLQGRYLCTDFSILEEVLVRAIVGGGRIAEVPLRYRERASGRSHVRPIQFSISYGLALLRMWRLRFLSPREASGAHSVKTWVTPQGKKGFAERSLASTAVFVGKEVALPVVSSGWSAEGRSLSQDRS